MEAKVVKKYQSRSIPWLLSKATFYFNRYIRKRDEGKPCITCGKYKVLEAGHYYPAGHYPMLRYNEDNVNGEDKHCNYYSGDHLIFYRENLIKRIGIERVEKLDFLAKYNKRTSHKWSRFDLIDVIETSKQKYKDLC